MRDLPSWAIATITILASLLAGGAAIWASYSQTGAAQFFLFGIGGVIITSGIFSTIGSYIARLQIAAQLSEQFRVGQKLESAGVVDVAGWPIRIPRAAQKVDILLIRGSGWLAMESTSIAKVLTNDQAEIRLCMLHPESRMIPTLSSKFGEPEQEVKDKILRSIVEVVECAEEARRDEGPGRLLLMAHKLVPTHTYYRFDDDYYVVWYGLRRGRIDVPLLRLRQGELSEFFSDDFERFLLEPDVETLYDSTVPPSEARETLSNLGVDATHLSRIFDPT